MPDSSVKPSLYIQLTHTGLLPDGRANTNGVQITDLDVGYENQNRKVPCYVPVGGSIIIPASSRSMLSFQQGVIHKFALVGIITAKMFYQPERFTTLGRPNPTTYPVGVHIWNTTKSTPEFSDGTQWVGPPSSLVSFGYFSDSTTQTATLANTAYYIKYNTVEVANGMTLANNTLGDPSRITVSEDGVYEIGYSVQLNKSGGPALDISIWATLNRENGGGNIPRSNNAITLTNNSVDITTFFKLYLALHAGDYVEFAWSGTGSGATLTANPAGVSPTRPADPSVVVTAKRFSSLP